MRFTWRPPAWLRKIQPSSPVRSRDRRTRILPLAEIVRDYSILPKITSEYFHRPALSALFTPMLGVPLFVAVAVGGGLVAGARALWQRRPVP